MNLVWQDNSVPHKSESKKGLMIQFRVGVYPIEREGEGVGTRIICNHGVEEEQGRV